MLANYYSTIDIVVKYKKSPEQATIDCANEIQKILEYAEQIVKLNEQLIKLKIVGEMNGATYNLDHYGKF